MSRSFVVTFIVVLLVTGAAVVVFVLKQRDEHQRFHDEITKRLNALRAAGEPLTAGDIAKLYPDPPPEQDAQRLLAPVLERLHVPDTDELDRLPVFGPARFPRGAALLDNHTQKVIEQLLETNRPALEAAEQMHFAGAWFATGLSQGFTNLSELRLQPLRNLAKLLCLDAAMRAERQDSAGAARSINCAFQIGRTCRSSVPIRELTGKATEGSACRALERVLNCTSLGNTELDFLAAATADEDADGLKRMFANERAMGLFIFETYGTTATQLVNRARSPISYLWTRLAARRFANEQDLLSYLEWEDQLFGSLRLSSKDQLEWVATNKPPLPKNRKRASAPLLLAMPDLSSFCKGEALALASLRLANTAIAIERWRIVHSGSLPETLAQLTPEFLPNIPIDPFADQPLHYQKLVHGYRIYSIGPDFTDDNGKEKPADVPENSRWDVTFTVER